MKTNSSDTSSWNNFKQTYNRNKMSPPDEPCPKCKSSILLIDGSYSSSESCKNCRKPYKLLKCNSCFFRVKICPKCLIIKESQQETKPNGGKCPGVYVLATVAFGLIAVCCAWKLNTFSESQQLPDVMERLRGKFPSQKNETLYHILSVLERTKPTVKSITLLHGDDTKTPKCLAGELVDIFSRNVDINEVSFDIDGVKFKDYGEILVHYHAVVEKFRVLVTNLNKVPASIARVFHSLCDEVSSDIKPSLFIFILREKKETNMKPLEKATTILKQAWNELPDSDLYPLLSRVVKNVVDVIPEKNSNCSP